MIAADPLFGPIVIPEWLEHVLRTPEVQRLREVRLINTTTPDLAALSDTRRYTHTIGVLALAMRLHPQLVGTCSRGERDALLLAAILHDVGTPPFAHLFEYLLKAINGWTHEGMLKHIVAGDYRPEGKYAQLYYGNQLGLADALKGIESEAGLALEYVEGRGALGTLIAGRVDLDNIDNVYRMCWLLGFRPDTQDALALADGLGVLGEGRATILRSCRPHLDIWRTWRRRAYEILAFDESSLQGQAMLTDALSYALQHSILGEEQWSFTDEQLLKFLHDKGRQFPYLRSIIQRFMIGDFYEPVFLGWYSQGQGSDDLRLPMRREELRSKLEDRLGYPCCPYIFYDNGTFEKEIELFEHVSDDSISSIVGSTSRSTIAAVFTPQRGRRSRRNAAIVASVMEEFDLQAKDLTPIPSKQSVYDFAGQAQLPF